MFIMGNFIIAIAKILDIVLFWCYWLILIRALISWVNPDPFNPIVQFLMRMTEPFLAPIRRFLPSSPIDLSVVVAFFVIIFLQTFLVASLKDIGYYMRQSKSEPAIQSSEYNDRKPFEDEKMVR
ncbi:MAG TPA: hypothetical protein DD723_04725 [Candidatus Omnitrophica bacterium]|nr:MAG: hypothetical protein A2Z81_05165 [Omnitrophica WOR_2 bacterium GWA2_45_18]HBR14833.1 hypothetical protein [Candidatus Omnitrophota bacterium]